MIAKFVESETSKVGDKTRKFTVVPPIEGNDEVKEVEWYGVGVLNCEIFPDPSNDDQRALAKGKSLTELGYTRVYPNGETF